MGAKLKSVWVCSECGHESIKWTGQCSNCGSWNTLEETLKQPSKKSNTGPKYSNTEHYKPTLLADIQSSEDERYKTGLKELDRVLGGGIVKGSVVLLGGDPGIGKSTILL